MHRRIRELMGQKTYSWTGCLKYKDGMLKRNKAVRLERIVIEMLAMLDDFCIDNIASVIN